MILYFQRKHVSGCFGPMFMFLISTNFTGPILQGWNKHHLQQVTLTPWRTQSAFSRCQMLHIGKTDHFLWHKFACEKHRETISLTRSLYFFQCDFRAFPRLKQMCMTKLHKQPEQNLYSIMTEGKTFKYH